MKKAKGLLKSQKPKRRKFVILATLKGLAWSVLFIFLSVMTYKAYQIFSDKMGRFLSYLSATLAQQNSLSDIRVIIESNAPEKLTSQTLREIKQTVRSLYNSDDNTRLSAISQEIYRNSQFSQVSTTQFAPGVVNVFVKIRQPVALIDCNESLRYLSQDFEVYGLPGNDDKLVLLRGFFDKPLFQNKLENHWQLDSDVKKNITRALDLYNITQKNNIMVREIQFDRYRGYAIMLAKQGAVVTLGDADFEAKMARLNVVLRNLENEGKQAANIELDFADKAFVKEQKL